MYDQLFTLVKLGIYIFELILPNGGVTLGRACHPLCYPCLVKNSTSALCIFELMSQEFPLMLVGARWHLWHSQFAWKKVAQISYASPIWKIGK